MLTDTLNANSNNALAISKSDSSCNLTNGKTAFGEEIEHFQSRQYPSEIFHLATL
jgi:hypothetical protein